MPSLLIHGLDAAPQVKFMRCGNYCMRVARAVSTADPAHA
jgi:hypothetical protein